ncbi:SHOCT domain-containing protein [Puerhibacterium puerhi]|uniref:SHOCT domain-containing protein n=1 Tax=Puerhibacterium puerhi TaxID=2692623 RepID=UPI00191517A6|nr:SHOCT domain-containing protein [Puerhibacterium puerhi]
MSDAPLLELTSHIAGKNATVRVYPDRVEWERGKTVSGGKVTAAVLTAGVSALATGLRTRRGAGTEVIVMDAITSVTTRRDSMFNDVVSVITGGNTIDMRVSRDEGERLKSTILAAKAARAGHHAAASTPAPVATPAAPSSSDRLRELADLHAAGILTDEEFAAAKAKALGL